MRQLVIDIGCQYGASDVASEAHVVTTATGVRWTITGGLATALSAIVAEGEEALRMVRDADNDCRADGLPTIPPMPRATIEHAISVLATLL